MKRGSHEVMDRSDECAQGSKRSEGREVTTVDLGDIGEAR
jgi:hypothetical protein